MAQQSNIGQGFGGGVQVGAAVAGIFAQHKASQAAMRALDNNLKLITSDVLRNSDAVGLRQNALREATQARRIEVTKKVATAKGTARVQAAQLGVGGRAAEDIQQGIAREAGFVQTAITTAEQTAFSDINREYSNATQGLQNQMLGLNTNIPAPNYTAAVVQFAGGGIDAYSAWSKDKYEKGIASKSAKAKETT